jgi:hypothetical protein
MPYSRALQTLAAAAAPAAAGPPATSGIGSWPVWGAALGLGLVVAASVALGVFFVRARRRRMGQRNAAEDRRFADSAVRCGLGEAEIARLRSLAGLEPKAAPSAIFDSLALFERCVNTAVREMVPADMTPEQTRAEGELLGGIRRKLGYNVLPLEHPLISTRNIAVGQTGSLVGGEGLVPLVPRAVVVGNDEFTIKIQYDLDRDDSYHQFPTNELRFAFSRRNDGSYTVPLTVAEYDDTGVLAAFHTLEFTRNQLRQFARIEVSLPVRFQLVSTVAPERSEVKIGQSVEARMLDLSGGGLSFACAVLLRPGDGVALTFSIPSGGFNSIAARVLRVALQESKGQTLYSHHLEFPDLDPTSRELIVGYVFQRQRQINQWQ